MRSSKQDRQISAPAESDPSSYDCSRTSRTGPDSMPRWHASQTSEAAERADTTAPRPQSIRGACPLGLLIATWRRDGPELAGERDELLGVGADTVEARRDPGFDRGRVRTGGRSGIEAPPCTCPDTTTRRCSIPTSSLRPAGRRPPTPSARRAQRASRTGAPPMYRRETRFMRRRGGRRRGRRPGRSGGVAPAWADRGRAISRRPGAGSRGSRRRSVRGPRAAAPS